MAILAYKGHRCRLTCDTMAFVLQEDSFPRCALHNREMTMFCRNETCKQIICCKCRVAGHFSHNVVGIEEQKVECNKALYDAMNFIKDRTQELYESKTCVNDHYEFALAEVELARKTMVEKVNKAFEKERRKIVKEKENNLKQLTDGITDFEEYTEALKDVAISIRKMTKGSMDIELIKTIKQSVKLQLKFGIQNMKGVSYVNKFYPFSKQFVENLTHGVAVIDLPLAITGDMNRSQDATPGKSNSL